MMREFARLQGCSVQWARALRRRGAQAWRDFAAGRGAGAPGSPAGGNSPGSGEKARVGAQGAAFSPARVLEPSGVQEAQDAPAAAPGAPDHGEAGENDPLGRARGAVAAQWRAYRRQLRIAEEAAARDDAAAVLPGLNRGVSETWRAYERAQAHLFTLQQEAREYVPISAVRGIKTALHLLEEVAANHRQRIAARLPDSARPDFFAAFDDVFKDWNAGIDKVDEYVNGLMPCLKA